MLFKRAQHKEVVKDAEECGLDCEGEIRGLLMFKAPVNPWILSCSSFIVLLVVFPKRFYRLLCTVLKAINR